MSYDNKYVIWRTERWGHEYLFRRSGLLKIDNFLKEFDIDLYVGSMTVNVHTHGVQILFVDFKKQDEWKDTLMFKYELKTCTWYFYDDDIRDYLPMHKVESIKLFAKKIDRAK